MNFYGDEWFLIASLIGAVFVVFGLRVRKHAYASWEWPTTIAKVIEAGVPWRDRGEGAKGDWSVSFRFTYQFQGLRLYKWETYNPRVPLKIEGGHIASAANGIVGRDFEVLFNPNKPSEVLTHGPKNPGWGLSLIMVGGVLITAGSAYWLLNLPDWISWIFILPVLVSPFVAPFEWFESLDPFGKPRTERPASPLTSPFHFRIQNPDSSPH